MHIASGRDPVIVKVPIDGTGTDIAHGALMMPGVTAETDLGTAIVASSAGADAIGVLRGAHDSSNDTNVDGTVWTLGEIELCDQYSPVWVEYDQTDTVDVGSTSGTTVTISSLENNIDTSWLFAVSGTGAGKLAFLDTSASGSATSKTATGWDSTTSVIKILRIFHQLAKLNTAADMIGTDAGAGSWTVAVLENWFKADGYALQLLDPTQHDDLTLTNARFFSKVLVRNTLGHTTE